MTQEYITCTKCGIQQKSENFWYCSSRHKVCKYCNKKTNVIPSKYDTTTEDAINYLTKILYDPKNDTSIMFQMQMMPVFDFLNRQKCKEQEAAE